MWLRLRGRVLRFPRPVMVMGIVNVTPDSFSDGGRFLDPPRGGGAGAGIGGAGRGNH